MIKQSWLGIFTACLLLSTSYSAYASRPTVLQPPTHASDLPEIIKRINAEDRNIRFQGLDDLLRMEPPEAAQPALPAVIAVTKLKKKGETDFVYNSLQSQAFQMLGRLPRTEETANILFEAAKQDESCKPSPTPAPITVKISPPTSLTIPTPILPPTDEEKRLAAAKTLPAAPAADCAYKTELNRSAAQNIPVDDKYLPQMEAVLKNDDFSVRSAAVQRFGNLPAISKQAAGILKSVLVNDNNSYVKIAAAQVIADKAKHRAEFAPALIAAIKGEQDKFHKLFYVRALAETGGTPAGELPLFITLLTSLDENESTRYSSAQVIGGLEAKAAAAVPALIQEVTSDSNQLVRGYSTEALGKIGPAAKDAIPALITQLGDRDTPNYRFYAAEALGKIASKDNKEATVALIAALSDQETETQKRTLFALQAQHNNSPEVMNALKELRIEENSPNAILYQQTVKLLSKNEQANVQLAKPLPVEEKLLSQLGDTDQQVQGAAVHQINKLPTVDAKFIPGLIKAFSSKDTLTTWYACQALGKAGTAAKDATIPIMALLKLQNSSSTGTGYCTAALAHIAPEDKTVLTFLSDAMLGGKVFASDDYANALALTDDAGVPYLIEGLKSENLYTVYLAAGALSRTTGNAKPALPVLMELLHQPEKLGAFTTQGWTTSSAVINAIKHIAPDSPELAKALEIEKTLPPPVSNR